MTELKIAQGQQGVFTLSGALNRHTVGNAWQGRSVALDALRKDNQSARLDLAGVSKIDTAGLAWLVNVVAEQKKRGLAITLLNCSDTMLKLAKISDLDRVLPLE